MTYRLLQGLFNICRQPGDHVGCFSPRSKDLVSNPYEKWAPVARKGGRGARCPFMAPYVAPFVRLPVLFGVFTGMISTFVTPKHAKPSISKLNVGPQYLPRLQTRDCSVKSHDGVQFVQHQFHRHHMAPQWWEQKLVQGWLGFPAGYPRVMPASTGGAANTETLIFDGIWCGKNCKIMGVWASQLCNGRIGSS